MILFILLFSYPLQKSLSLHLDASKIINIANGSYLMKWNDISGNSRNAIPIFGQNGAIFVNGTENDDPYLHFDGTSGYHVEDEIGSLTNMSIFVVHQPIFDGSRVGEYTDIVDSQGDVTKLFADDNGVYVINAFTTIGFHTYIVPQSIESIDVLVVAGGGGGGSDNGGGGGAGGLVFQSNIIVVPGSSYRLNVGSGGIGSTINVGGGKNGDNSAFGTIIGIGGGSGGEGECGVQKAKSGGSGGGGHGESKTCLSESNGATGLQPSSSSGGFGNSGGNGGTAGDNGGGGGGGAGSVGGNGNTTHGGVGGSGKYFGDIFGTFFGDNGWFSGGGGGGSQNKCSGCVNFGGLGGGGMGGPISNIHGRPNTGGGGGGRGFTSSYSEKGGNGGSGIVMVKSLHQSIFDVTYNDKEISINVSNSKAVIPLNVLCCENSILSIIFDENTARVWVDHMFQTSISPQNLMKANQWFIGSSLGSYFKGKISEVIVFNRSLTLNEKDEVELYIKNKWKTKTILPSNPRRFHRHFMIILFSFII